MIYLDPIIQIIRELLVEDTDQSITYAALEARLALEKVCYDRLRQRHDYISQADLRRWSPGHVINKIMAEVDPHIEHTTVLKIAIHEGSAPAEADYGEIGTEVGFSATYVSKLWNALSKLALHIRLPENRADRIQNYGNKAEIKKKVEEVCIELERLAKGDLTLSGFGLEVSFECACGQKNRRRAELLKQGQTIACFNPACSRSFIAHTNLDGSYSFELEAAPVPCASCDKITLAPLRELHEMKYNDTKIVKCMHCGHENHVGWRLGRIKS